MVTARQVERGMVRTAVGACALGLALILGCSRPAPQGPAWSFSPGGYFDGEDFHNGHYDGQTVIVAPAPSSTDRFSSIAVLDGRTGAPRWGRSDFKWYFWADPHTGPFYALGAQASQSPFLGPFTELVELDPEDGTERRRVLLETPVDAYARFYFDQGRLFAVEQRGDRLRQIDPATGATVVAFETPDAGDLFAPVFLEDHVVFQGQNYVAYSLEDGAEMFRIEGSCCGLLATDPWLHLRASADTVGVYTHAGAKVAEYHGQLAAAGGDRLVITVDLDAEPERDAIEVYVPPAREPIWRGEVVGYVSAVALYGDRLFYFRSDSDELVEVDLRHGRQRAVVKVGGHLVIGPDATGFSGPHLSAPPVYAAPWLYVEDFNNISAHRIDAE